MYPLFYAAKKINTKRTAVFTFSLLSALLATSFQGYAAEDAEYKLATTPSIPEITLFNPKVAKTVIFERTRDFDNGNGSGNFFSICDGREWVKGLPKKDASDQSQGILAKFIVPKFKGAVNPGPYYVTLAVENDKEYYMHIPLFGQLKGNQQDFESSTRDVTLAIRGPVPFDPNRKCDNSRNDNNGRPLIGPDGKPVVTPQVTQKIEFITRSIADATPVINHLVPTEQKVSADGTKFTASVKILGADTAEKTKIWWVDSNTEGGKEETHAMVRVQDLTTQKNDDYGFTGKEITGGVYTVELPIPTTLNYRAKVKVEKEILNLENKKQLKVFEEQLVGDDSTKPSLSLSSCTNRQCQINWYSSIPYRDVNGSLGLSLKGNIQSTDESRLPSKLFSLFPGSDWLHPTLFAGQNEKTLARGDWEFYHDVSSPFLTALPLPQNGTFLLLFEKAGS